MRRGYIFSIDALLALILALVMLSGIFLFMSRQSTPEFGSQDLQMHAQSLLIALDTNETLRKSITTNLTTTIQEILDNATAKSICANLSLLTTGMQQVASYQKANCTATGMLAVARRPLYYGGAIRLVVVETWYP